MDVDSAVLDDVKLFARPETALLLPAWERDFDPDPGQGSGPSGARGMGG